MSTPNQNSNKTRVSISNPRNIARTIPKSINTCSSPDPDPFASDIPVSSTIHSGLQKDKSAYPSQNDSLSLNARMKPIGGGPGIRSF